jgi:iron complex outermembrane recepter protein
MMMYRSTGTNPGGAGFSSEKISRLRWGIAAAGLGAALMSAVAVGQTVATAPAPELQEIIVTGSLIKRTDTETPSPVQVLTGVEIQQMGYTNLSQVLANLSANGQGTLSQSFGQAFASGASGVALRGLTVGDTLVLIDGKRMVDYPISDDNQRSFVDVSAIPFNAIERVEVLKDGASAIYGADAIAGVVNIILKKNYTGTEITAEAGTSQKHDGTTEHLAGISGIGDLANDGYNAYVAIDFHHQDQILAADRQGGFTMLDWSGLPGGLNTTPGSFGNPDVPYPVSTTGYLINPGAQNTNGTFANGLPGQAFLPGCTAQAQMLDQCETQYRGLQIQPSTGQTNVLAKFTKALAGDWTTSVSASVFDSKAEQVGPAFPTTGYAGGGIVNLAVAPGVNPAFVAYPIITVPANYPGNPYGAAAPLVYSFREVGLPTTLTDTDTYRLVADIKGTAAGWDIDGSLGAMYARMDLKELNELDPALIQPALNSGYVVGPGASPAAASLLAPEAISHPTSSLDIADLHASRPLFNMWGGPLSMAIGAQFFHKVENDLPPETISTGVQEGNAAFALGSQNDAAAFMEFNGNVVKQLELDGAVRYDNYNNGVGGATTPKISVKYKPIDQFVLRGTWGKGFRAPSPAESQQSGNFFGAGTTNDPILCPNPGNPNARGNFPGQCNFGLTGLQQPGTTLKPVKSTNSTVGFIFEPSSMFNVSADYYKIKLTNDIISELQVGGIGAYTSLVRGPSATLPFCSPTNPTPTCTPAQLTNTVTPVGLVAFGTFPYINAGETQTEGIDVDFQSHFDLDNFGKLTAELNYTHVIEYNQVVDGVTYSLAGTHGPSSISGDTGNPKDRAVFTLSWDKGPMTVSATLNYTSHFSITDPSSAVNTCEQGLLYGATSAYGPRFSFGPNATIPGYLCTVHTFVDTNLYARYALSDHLALHGSITNVFNRQPPVDAQTYAGGGQLAYDGSLNQDGAVGRFFLVGATYKF